jgi:hypothetical protein
MPDDEMYDPPSDSAGSDLEDDGVLGASDTLDGDPGDDLLDQGIVPPDRWSAGEGFGTTQSEERAGESLDQLLAEEEPDPDPYAQASLRPDDPRADDDQEPRAGRLVVEDAGAHLDAGSGLIGRDVGIDGGAATAEEAAVHVEDDTGGPPDA